MIETMFVIIKGLNAKGVCMASLRQKTRQVLCFKHWFVCSNDHSFAL